MKNKKKAKVIIFSFVVCILMSLFVFVCASDNIMAYLVHQAFVSAGPDTSNWVLENDDYTVIPITTDKTVTFYVQNKAGDVVFTCDKVWRDWDFKSINIDKNNVITADSADVGIYTYMSDDTGTFYLADPIFDDN